MKRIICLLLALALGGCLVGCGTTEPEETQVVTEFVPADTGHWAEPEPTEPETTEPQLNPSELPRLHAFQKTLLAFLQDYTGPEGEEIPYLDDFGPMEGNSFALADVDGDGKTELLLTLTNTPTAGMVLWVCDYNEETDSVSEELSIFPSVDFYTGGLAEAQWSHNQGLAGNTFWPYTLLGYNPSTNQYEALIHVDAWDRSFAEIDGSGARYPENIDTEGVGIVYLITQNGETQTLNQADYEQWHADLFGSAELIPVAWQDTTEANILALTSDQ